MKDLTALEKVIDKHIEECKQAWLVSCKCRSVEGMAINSSNVYFLLNLKVELDILTPDEYYRQLVAFDNFKKDSHYKRMLCIDEI